jgi:hypothetical protein
LACDTPASAAQIFYAPLVIFGVQWVWTSETVLLAVIAVLLFLILVALLFVFFVADTVAVLLKEWRRSVKGP